MISADKARSIAKNQIDFPELEEILDTKIREQIIKSPDNKVYYFVIPKSLIPKQFTGTLIYAFLMELYYLKYSVEIQPEDKVNVDDILDPFKNKKILSDNRDEETGLYHVYPIKISWEESSHNTIFDNRFVKEDNSGNTN